MNLLGQKVRDSVTGITGTVIAQAQYLHDSEGVLVSYGPAFDTAWLAVERVTPIEAVSAEKTAKASKANGVANGHVATVSEKAVAQVLAPEIAQATAAGKVATAAATVAALDAAPNAVTLAADVYAQVAKAFSTLGKAGHGPKILAILGTHDVQHAKQIQDNPAALLDVLKQAQAAIAALPSAGVA